MASPRFRFVRLAGLLTAITAALAAGGCHRRADGGLRVVVIGDRAPTFGDPLRGPDRESDAVLRSSIAQGLVQFDSGGQVEPGLAERWNVSDDGLSYIFRLAESEWRGGPKVTARDVARMLDRMFKSHPDDPTRDALGAVDEVVAMTDRVVEIRLRAPRPNLLTLLAQPDFALIRGGAGSGPFAPVEARAGDAPGAPLRLRRRLSGIDGEEGERQEVSLSVMPAAAAIAAFRDQKVDVVLGGTVADLPLVQQVKLDRGVLRFDPVAGLFGLMPVRESTIGADERLRHVLSEAIDRPALVGALAVPGLAPRATLLQQGLAGEPAPAQPIWLSQSIEARRPALIAAIDRAREAPRSEAGAQLTVAVGVPDGPGGDLVFARLAADWRPLGITTTRARKGERADFRLVDAVAPSDSPAWFVRRFRCSIAPICLEDLEPLLVSAREASDPRQRAGLLAEAAAKIDAAQLFIPLAAPIRWSLVARSVPGFEENRYARHPLGDMAASATGGTRP